MTVPGGAVPQRVLLSLALMLMTGCAALKTPVVDEDEPEPIQIAVDERCDGVDAALLETIVEGLTIAGELETARAVASDEHDVTFVAAELVGEGQPDEASVGIWAVAGDVEAGQPAILAVNAIAREYSQWPFDEQITEKTDGGEEVKACVDAAAATEHP